MSSLRPRGYPRAQARPKLTGERGRDSPGPLTARKVAQRAVRDSGDGSAAGVQRQQLHGAALRVGVPPGTFVRTGARHFLDSSSPHTAGAAGTDARSSACDRLALADWLSPFQPPAGGGRVLGDLVSAGDEARDQPRSAEM